MLIDKLPEFFLDIAVSLAAVLAYAVYVYYSRRD
jgi:uncharacterized membrane protein